MHTGATACNAVAADTSDKMMVLLTQTKFTGGFVCESFWDCFLGLLHQEVGEGGCSFTYWLCLC